jgi:hypothetical protein
LLLQKKGKTAILKTEVMTGSMLYIRFDIAKVEEKFNTGTYGMACYKTVFRNVPANLLQGCGVFMGDSMATLSGRENVCIIGIAASQDRLQSIRTVMSGSSEFLSVSDGNPLVPAPYGGTEPLVSDGVYTADGTGLNVWAKAAYDSLKKESSEKKETENAVPEHQPAPETPARKQDAENRPPAEIKRHGCLTAWLVFILVGSVGVLSYWLIDDNVGVNFDGSDVAVLVIHGLINIVSAILLLNWKKIGYWLFVCSSVAGVIINMASGIPFMLSLTGLLGLIILNAALFYKTNDGTGWDNLK